MPKKVLLQKEKIGDDLEDLKKKHKIIRETADEIVIEVDEQAQEDLSGLYEGLERMDE